MTKFQPGQSGNPNGRPKKDRALTAILETAGSKTIKDNEGKNVSRKRLMAEYLWEAVSTGEITFPDGKVLKLSPSDVLDIIQFLYKHIDGPPVQSVDLNAQGALSIEVEYVNTPYPTPDVSSRTSGNTSKSEKV